MDTTSAGLALKQAPTWYSLLMIAIYFLSAWVLTLVVGRATRRMLTLSRLAPRDRAAIGRAYKNAAGINHQPDQFFPVPGCHRIIAVLICNSQHPGVGFRAIQRSIWDRRPARWSQTSFQGLDSYSRRLLISARRWNLSSPAAISRVS